MNFQERCVFPPLPQPRNAVDDRTFEVGEQICIRPGSVHAGVYGTIKGKYVSRGPFTNTHRIEVIGNNPTLPGVMGTTYTTFINYASLGKYYPLTNEIAARSVTRQKNNIKVGKEGNQGRAINTAMAEKLFLPFLRPQGGKSRKARRGGRKTRRNRK